MNPYIDVDTAVFFGNVSADDKYCMYLYVHRRNAGSKLCQLGLD